MIIDSEYVHNFDNIPLIDLFEGQAKKSPNNIAIVYKETRISYSELDEKADRIASMLVKKGAGRDVIVGITSKKSIEMIIGILGILKSGSAYLPIDPTHPSDRVKYMIESSGVKILLTTDDSNIDYYIGNCQKINIYESLDNNQTINEISVRSGDSLIYIIYTSGTTGIPKAILTENRNVVAYVKAFNEIYNISSKDVTLLQSSIMFDGFVEEIYTVFSEGGKVVIPDDTEVRSPKLLKKIIDKNNVTILSCTPQILNEFNKLEPMESVRIYLSSGEQLKSEYYSNIIKYAKVYNMYGPTESTVCASYYLCKDNEMGKVPIGKPIPFYDIYILDENMNLLSGGEIGELYISGKGVSRGYLNNNQMTSENFLEDPFVPGYRMYKTGDSGRFAENGDIEFIGRKDTQVKIRGFRVELGEIEYAIKRYPSVNEVVVIMKESEKGDKYLCAYYVSESEISSYEIKQFLNNILPDYMIPLYFTLIDKIPLTPNGKTDFKALCDLDYKAEKNIVQEVLFNDDIVKERFVNIVYKICDTINSFNFNNDLQSIGVNSIKFIELVVALEKEYNFEFEDDKLDYQKFTTVNDLFTYVVEMCQSSTMG